MNLQVAMRASDVVQREVAGETFLVPVRGHLADLQELFVLNEVGSWIWERLDGRTSVHTLAVGVADEFEVEVHEAERDIAAFLDQLSEISLVQWGPEELVE